MKGLTNGYLGVLSMLVLLSSCASVTPHYDAAFGHAIEQAKANQTVSGNPNKSLQMDARALHNGMVNYMGDRPAPQAIQGVINKGASGQ